MGQKQVQMDASIAPNNVREFYANVEDDPSVRPLSWRQRRMLELGVLEMAPSTRPPELRLNYSTALFYLAVIGAILGGFWFMYDRIAEANYQRGVADSEKKQVERQLNDMQKELQIIKKLNEASK